MSSKNITKRCWSAFNKFSKLGTDRQRTEEKFFCVCLSTSRHVQVWKPDTLLPREVKYGSNKVAAPRPFVFSLCYVGGCRRQIHSHARTQTHHRCLLLGIIKKLARAYLTPGLWHQIGVAIKIDILKIHLTTKRIFRGKWIKTTCTTKKQMKWKI